MSQRPAPPNTQSSTTRSNAAAFYHVWAPGLWKDPLDEFLIALEESGFHGDLTVGVVGNFAERAQVQSYIKQDCEYVLSPSGWEQITLDAIRSYALYHDGSVLYGHSKGAYNPSERQREIRSVLYDQIVRRWEENALLLEDYDAVGYGWTPKEEGYQAFFMGNFWTARCSYLRQLPVCSRLSRFRAEGWLGEGDPRVYDLAPERPVYDGLRWEPVRNSDVSWG